MIDADLTGTSLSDGLALRAPTAIGYLTLAETRAQRRPHPQEAPYLNQLLQEPGADLARFPWIHPDRPDILWFPSSPTARHTHEAIKELFTEPEAFAQRLSSTLERIGAHLGSDGLILVDLPPGMFGVPTVLSQALRATGQLIPVLVTTPDRNDLLRSADQIHGLVQDFLQTVWVLNRHTDPVSAVREELRDHWGEAFKLARPEQTLKGMDWSGEGLGRLYRADRLQLPEQVTQRIVTILERDAQRPTPSTAPPGSTSHRQVTGGEPGCLSSTRRPPTRGPQSAPSSNSTRPSPPGSPPPWRRHLGLAEPKPKGWDLESEAALQALSHGLRLSSLRAAGTTLRFRGAPLNLSGVV